MLQKTETPASRNAQAYERNALVDGFLRASAAADCSSDDADGLDRAEWSNSARMFANDAIDSWLRRISSYAFDNLIIMTPPAHDYGVKILQAIGENVYHAMRGHDVGFHDEPKINEIGLAKQASDAARSFSIEGPHLGEDGKRHFVDEYGLHRTMESRAERLDQSVRQVLAAHGIVIPASGHSSLTGRFEQSLDMQGYQPTAVKTPEKREEIKAGLDTEYTAAVAGNADPLFLPEEAQAAITASVALVRMDVAENIQREVLEALASKADAGQISPDAVRLFVSPPSDVLRFIVPETAQKVTPEHRFGTASNAPAARDARPDRIAPSPGL